MKTSYGSQNQEEESAFIRRVAAPTDESRRKQKRMAAVGASVVLLAAGAVCTYAALPQEKAAQTPTTNLQAKAQYLLSPEELSQDDNSGSGDADSGFVPDFGTYDANGDGSISNAEYIARLAANRDDALDRVARSSLSDEKKALYSDRLRHNFETQVGCVTKLAKRDTKTNGDLTEDRFPLFYNMIKEFCLLEDVHIPAEFQPVEIAPP
ncbi:TPA: hypothetical protein N0F65_008396, partial [Lagenidium giganteum]